MRIAACDDNTEFLDHFHKLLLSLALPDDTVTTYTGGLQLIDDLGKYATAIDLLFLDIKMPGLSGLESTREIMRLCPCTYVVLVTNFSQFALEAFEVGASHYLLKPVNVTVLAKTINKYRHQLLEKSKMITIVNRGEINRIRHHDIVYITRDSRKIYVHLPAGTLVWPDKTMSGIEKILKPDGFFRVHQSYIVNIHHIRNVKNLKALMSNGEVIPIGDRNITALKEAILKYRRLQNG